MACINSLTVNYRKNPVGVSNDLKLSYKISSSLRGDKQISYRILISKEIESLEKNIGEIYDSGEVFSENTANIVCKKHNFAPVTKYFWKVIAKTEKEILESEIAYFVTAKNNEKWSAKWLSESLAGKADSALAASYFRKPFAVNKTVKEAYLSICGVGMFLAEINGQKISDDHINTPYTKFDTRIYYFTYDVTPFINNGKNVLGVTLGNGWYNIMTQDVWSTNAASWRHLPKFISELKIKYDDGSTYTVKSDASWKFHYGPITFNGIRHGTIYDARKELGNWTSPEYIARKWHPARLIRSPGGALYPCDMQTEKKMGSFTAQRMWKTPNGAYIFDLGQNISGVGRYTVHGKKGTEIVFRHGDKLYEDNTLDCQNSFIKNFEFQTDRYIKKSDEAETYSPDFVYHGFQYVEVSGIDYEPSLSDISADMVYTAVDRIAEFHTNDETVNKITDLCHYASVANLHGLPTDCPHREKNGWTGDGSLSSEQMLINYDIVNFFDKWAADMRDAQRPAGQIASVAPTGGWGYNGINGPDWSSALVQVPYNTYLYTGDISFIEKNYEAIKKNCEFTENMSNDYIANYGIGDWCPPFDGPAIAVNMRKFKCPIYVSDTAFFYNLACKLVFMARLLGKKADERKYLSLAKKIKASFIKHCYNKETHTVAGDCQTSYALTLYFGLYEKEDEEALMNKLLEKIKECDGHLDFGVLGCLATLRTLGQKGMGKIGLDMLTNPTYPSVKWCIDNGATTLWECWNGRGSHDHHMFSDMMAFMYRYIAGLAPDENNPGFKNTVFAPDLNCGLTDVKASRETVYGSVAIHWTKENENISISLEIPFGTTGTLILPVSVAEKLFENGVKLKDIGEYSEKCGKAEIILVSGKYNFVTK